MTDALGVAAVALVVNRFLLQLAIAILEWHNLTHAVS
jgi:hypothetical protein